MFNPLKRAAELARQAAQDARAHPALADVPEQEIFRAAEVHRLAELADRTRRAREAQAEADELDRRAEQLDQAVTDHHAAEAREVERLNTAAAALDTSRRALAKASTAADKALAGLYAAAEAHDALVVQTAAELRTAGLTAAYADGDAVVEFQSGGARDGVVLRGVWWTRLDPRLTVRRCLYGALRAVGDRSAEAERLRNRLDLVGRGLLPALPPAFVAPVPAWRAEIAAAHHAAMTPPPVKVSVRDEVDVARERHAEEKADRQARQAYATARAELVAEKGEDHVRALEQRYFHDGKPFGVDPAEVAR